MKEIEIILHYIKEQPLVLMDVFGAMILAISALFFAKSLQNYYKAICFYSISSFLFEIIANYYAAHKLNNHTIFIVFYIIETILISYFYLKYFNKQTQKIVIFCIAISIILLMLNNLIFNQNELDDIASSVQSIGLIVFSLICFYNILANQEIKNLLEAPIFWINSAVFIYFSGKFFVFLFITKVLDPKYTNLVDFWYIITYLIFIFRMMFSFAISKTKSYNLKIN